jgi:hypothetical protein
MEIYIPYVVGSTIASFVGGISYKYYNSESNVNLEESNETIISNENDLDLDLENESKTNLEEFKYDILEDEIKNNNKYLGKTRNQKFIKMRNICKEECNIDIGNINKKSKNKMSKYIREYEDVGHKEFVLNHIQNRL